MIDQQADPELYHLLYGGDPYPTGYGNKPYMVTKFSDNTMRHWPGLKGVPEGMYWNITARGYRGINVLSYSDPVGSHPVQLRWAGIDIDAGDNQKYTCIHNIVREALPQAMVRLSKSGLGVHVILWLKPDFYPIVSYDEAKALAKAMVAQPKVTLAAAGIVTCVTGLPNLWLWSEGGKQRTVQVGEPVEIPGYSKTVTPTPRGTGIIRTENFAGPAGLVAAKWFGLNPAGTWPRRSQVNVGEFRRRTGIEVPTKSKCRESHAGECNGWLVLSEDGSLKLFSNADDNQCILALYSL